MLNLEQIVFKVDTTELQTAAKQVADLGSKVKSLAQEAKGISKESAQAAKIQAEANLLNAKASNEAAKASTNKAKADKEANSANEEVIKTTKARLSIEEKQRSTLEFMTQGYSKGQASILAYAKSIGESTDAIGSLLQAQRRLQGGDPFDKSLGSLQLFKNELLVLEKVQDLYNRNIGLTMAQMQNLGREHVRLTEQFKLQGKSMDTLEKEYEQVVQAAVKLTDAENKIRNAMSNSESASKDSAKAMSFLEREISRVDNVLEGFNTNLGVSTSNRLTKFREQLKLSGVDANTAALMLKNYEDKLRTIETTNQKKIQSNRADQLNYLARATSVQLGDIGISLAGGQNPLTVLIQQGDQLRGVLNQVGADANEMKMALSSAFRQIVVGGYDVVKALGTFVVGSFVDTGKAAVNLVGKITGLNAVFEQARYQLTLFAMANPTIGGGLLKTIEVLRVAFLALNATIMATVIGAVIALGVALKQVISENNNLAVSLALSGGSFGMLHSTTIEYVKALGEVGVTTGKATEAIVAMSKAGVFAKDDIMMVATAAADMSTYAGVAIEDTVKEFAKLREKPVEALVDIAKATGLVPPAILEMVMELEKSGKSADAASLAMKTYADVTKTQIAQMKENYNGFSLFIIDLGKGIKQFFSDAFKTLFLATDPTEQLKNNLADIQKRIKKVSDNQKFNSFFGISANPGLLDSLKEQERQLLKMLDLQVANNQAKEAEIVANAENARIQSVLFKAFEKNDDALDKHMKKVKSLSEWQDFYTDKQIEKYAKEANVNKEQIKLTDEQIAQLKEKAKIEWDSANKKKPNHKQENYLAALMREATNATISANGAVEELTKSQIKLQEVQADPRYQALSQGDKERVAAIYEQAIATEKATAAQDLANKILGKADMLGSAYFETIKRIDAYQKSGEYSAEYAEQLRQAEFDKTELAKTRLKIEEESYKLVEKYKDENQKVIDSTVLENSKLDDRIALLGLTSEQQKYLSIEQERRNKLLAIDLKLQRQIQDVWDKWGNGDFGVDGATKAKAVIVDLERAAAEERKNINKEVAVQYAEDFMKEFNTIRDGISDSIVTALFEGGKAGSKKLRDVVMDALRRPVTLVVNAVVNTIMGSILGSILGGGGSSGAGGSILGSIAGSAGTSMLGSAMGVGTGASLIGGYTGSIIPASMVGPSVAAPTMMSGLGNMLSAIPGWGIGIGAVLALGALLSKKSTPHMGAGSTYSAAGGLQSIDLEKANEMGFKAKYSKETQTFTDQIAKGIGMSLDETAKTFGKDVAYEVSTAFADDTSKDGAWGQFRVKKKGQDLINWGTETAAKGNRWAPREYADGEAGMKQYMTDIAKSARDALKDAIGDVGWATDMLDALGDSPTLEQVSATIDQINAAKKALDGFGLNIQGFADLTDKAVSALVEASGGMQSLLVNMQSFYDNFYSEEEKKANVQRDITKALKDAGLEMPKSRAEYRKMVEEQMALGEAGAKKLAVLLKYSGAFASITEDSAKAAQDELDRQEAARKAIIERQKEILKIQIDAAEAQVNIFQKLFDFLDGEIKKLYGSVESTAKMQLSQARDLIANAVATRKLPEQSALEDAVGTITGSFNNKNYATKVDAERDRLKFAAQLDDLKSIAGNSLASAKNTFDILKLQLAALEDAAVMDKKQLDGLYTIDDSLQDVIDAINNIGKDDNGTETGNTKPIGYNGGSSGVAPASANPYQTRVSYGADEALSDFEKFKAWYVGLRVTSKGMAEGYKTPDWMRINGLMQKDNSDESLFGDYLFFKNNPQYAKDYEKIMSGGTSDFSTTGESIVKTDLDKLPSEIRDYYKNNTNTLLAYEGAGVDPVLAYKVAKYGAESIGIDPKKTNVTEYMRTHKWTENGVVESNNHSDLAFKPYKGYNLARYDNQNQVIVDVDGTLYTLDGKPVGTASRDQMTSIYGADYVNNTGGNYGSTMRSRLYNQNIGYGYTPEQYYSDLRKYTDQMITGGWTAQQIVDAMKETGASLEDMGHAYGVPASVIADNLRANGATNLPTFAGGGMYGGGIALVGEEGPELINFNNGGYVSTASETRAALDQTDVCEQLMKLNERIEMIEIASRSIVISSNKSAKILERVSPDGDSIHTKAV